MASQPAATRGPGGKRKRVVLTLREKIDICTRLERGESRRALMQEYNVGMSTLYDIRAHKAQLLRFFASSASHSALERRRTLHTPKLERLDRVLYEWFLGRRAEGVPVSGPMLVEKARDLYGQMRLTEPCVFSGGWLWRFKARHGIKKLDAAGERPGAAQQAAEQFCGFFRSLAAEHGLSPEQVYNADETGLFWRRLPSANAAATTTAGAMPALRQTKDRLTVLTCANATGSHKIRPLVIGKGSGVPTLKGPPQLPVAYRAQGNAWVDREVFADWFRHIFVPSVKEHFSAVGFPADSKAVLLLDSSRAHPQEAELAADNVFTILLPASVAALVQPMDQGIRRDFLRRFVSPAAPVPSARPRCSLHDAVLRVAGAWDAVPRDVFSRAWEKLWPAAAMAEGSSSEEEGERGPVSQNQPLAHVPELVQDAPPEPHQLPLGVVEQPPTPTGPTQAEGSGNMTQTDSEGAGEAVAWAQAAESFAVVVAFAEQQPCFSAQEVGQLRALRSVFARQQRAREHLAPRAVVKLEPPRECSPLPCSSTAGH